MVHVLSDIVFGPELRKLRIKLFFYHEDFDLTRSLFCARVGENYLGEHEGHSDGDGSDDGAAAEE